MQKNLAWVNSMLSNMRAYEQKWSIFIRYAKCVKCYNIWHLAHQTPKYELHQVFYMCHFFETCYSTLSSLARSGWECYMRLLFFYSSFSLISIKIYHHLHVQSLIFCFSISILPYSFLLPSSIFLYSLLIHESWATTDFLSTISQIPPSLIYIISFTGSTPPFFRSLLTDLWSHTSRDEDRLGSPLITDPLCDKEEL